MSRLEEIRTNLVARPQEAMEQCWLGEVAAIETTMAAAAQKVESHAGTGGQHPRPIWACPNSARPWGGSAQASDTPVRRHVGANSRVEISPFLSMRS
jgi:hypothetical protein